MCHHITRDMTDTSFHNGHIGQIVYITKIKFKFFCLFVLNLTLIPQFMQISLITFTLIVVTVKVFTGGISELVLVVALPQ